MIVSSGSAFLPWQAKYSLEDYVKKTNHKRCYINDFYAATFHNVRLSITRIMRSFA